MQIDYIGLSRAFIDIANHASLDQMSHARRATRRSSQTD
jgi:hypothetical protein